MDNKLFIGIAAVVVIALGLLSYAQFKAVESVDKLGTNVTYSTALSNLNLYNVLSSIRTDLIAVRAPLAGLAYTTTSVNWGTLDGTDTVSSSAAFELGSAGTVGDLCLTEPATAASSSATFRCEVTTTGTANASATIHAIAESSSSAAIGVRTMNVWVLPVSSFDAPAAITTGISTSTGE